MKKLFIVLVLYMFSNMVLAYSDVDVRGLTETQKAELALQAAKMKEATTTPPVETVKKVADASDAALDMSKKWAGVGKELAIGIVATAKELGVTANEFAQTPLGKMATTLIIWKYIGKDILNLGFSMMLIFIGLPVVYQVAKKLLTSKVIYEDVPFVFGITRRKVKSIEYISDDDKTPVILIYAIVSIAVFLEALHLFPT